MAYNLQEKLKVIASLNNSEGREKLRQELGWLEFDEENDLQTSIHLDCLYDHLKFMVTKGFQWNEITVLFQIFQNILDDCKGQTVGEVITYLTQKLHSAKEFISEASVKCYSEFFFTTYMHHYKLYQYVFTIKQEKSDIKTDLEINIPPSNIPPFTEARIVDVYNYEKKYKEIKALEEEKLQEQKQSKETFSAQGDKIINEAVSEVHDPPLQREELLKLIDHVTSANVSAASNSLGTAIKNMYEDLDIKLQLTALPRPAALGPPPRYKIRSPPSSSSKLRTITSRETLKSKSGRSSSKTKK